MLEIGLWFLIIGSLCLTAALLSREKENVLWLTAIGVAILLVSAAFLIDSLLWRLNH